MTISSITVKKWKYRVRCVLVNSIFNYLWKKDRLLQSHSLQLSNRLILQEYRELYVVFFKIAIVFWIIEDQSLLLNQK